MHVWVCGWWFACAGSLVLFDRPRARQLQLAACQPDLCSAATEDTGNPKGAGSRSAVTAAQRLGVICKDTVRFVQLRGEATLISSIPIGAATTVALTSGNICHSPLACRARGLSQRLRAQRHRRMQMKRSTQRGSARAASVAAAFVVVCAGSTQSALADPTPTGTASQASSSSSILSSIPNLSSAMGVGVDFIATMLPEGAIEKQNTAAPANGIELSTNPACAATMLIAVPGTFETSRDYNPATPIGQLAKLAEPLKSVGSATFINYDADYSVNGTSYVKSVEGGVGKTLATIQDAATRCPQARFLLAGFSQGAQIAGDVAVAIGHKRTSVDPSRVLGVALYSDPKRAVDSNVLVDTTQTQPSLPLTQGAPNTTTNPSLAQLQLQNTNGFTSLAGQTGVVAAGSTATATTTVRAGQAAATTTTNAAGVTTSHVAPSGTSSTSRTTGPALPFPGAVAGITATTTPRPAGATDTSMNQSAGATTTRSVNDGGLSAAYSNSLANSTAKPAVNTDPAARVDVPELTLRAVSGGGIERARSENFGELTGRVAEFCVAGDTICSLPANSMLAQAVVKLTDNLSVDLNEIKTSDGGLGMAGIMGIQAINTVADVFGMPHTKLSSTTLVALGKLAVGSIMTSTGNVAGAALIADATSALVTAMPEIFAQLADIPSMILALPNSLNKAAQNLGLDSIMSTINGVFAGAGLTNPADLITQLPTIVPKILQALFQENSGMLALATNPSFYSDKSKHEGWTTLMVAGNMNSIDWTAAWFKAVSGAH
jgi:hypothetical protein